MSEERRVGHAELAGDIKALTVSISSLNDRFVEYVDYQRDKNHDIIETVKTLEKRSLENTITQITLTDKVDELKKDIRDTAKNLEKHMDDEIDVTKKIGVGLVSVVIGLVVYIWQAQVGV